MKRQPKTDRRRGDIVFSAFATEQGMACGLVLLGMLTMACDTPGNGGQTVEGPDWKAQRHAMVSNQIEARGVRDPIVLEAMRSAPRHLFVPENSRTGAYLDSPMPIGENQTISQPYIVALMTELLEVGPGSRVLEIGTGSGYQAAVLAEMGVEVFSIEIRPGLCERAKAILMELDYENVHVRCGDGYGGWPSEAPFDGVVVTAAPEQIPSPLIDQLKDQAHMVIPVGSFYQELKVITKNGESVGERSVIPVRFVPMTGEVETQE